MFINRTERVQLDPSRRAVANRKNKGESFEDTITSVIEVDVVEVGDGTDDEKRNAQQHPFQKKPEEQKPEATRSSLDIKV